MIGHGKGTRHFKSFHVCEVPIALVCYDAFKRDSPILNDDVNGRNCLMSIPIQRERSINGAVSGSSNLIIERGDG